MQDDHGLAAAGVLTAAGLVGVALSAPATSWLSHRLPGRGLLAVSAVGEAALRAVVAVLVLLGGSGVPVPLLAAAVAAMNVLTWTGYAGMRAEVAAVTTGSTGLAWYAAGVGAVEAAGVAAAAVLPLVPLPAHVLGLLVPAAAVAYVLALLPQLLVAFGSRVPRALPPPPREAGWGRPRRRGPRLPVVAVAGAAVMLLASGPVLLAVPLAQDLHGRASVALTGLALTAGSLAGPALAGLLERRWGNQPRVWVLCGVGMVSGWVVAPWSTAALCAAAVLAGASAAAAEGLFDDAARLCGGSRVARALAGATAARALGSAAATAALPLLLAAAGSRPDGTGIAAGPGPGTGLVLVAGSVAVVLCVTAVVLTPRGLVIGRHAVAGQESSWNRGRSGGRTPGRHARRTVRGDRLAV